MGVTTWAGGSFVPGAPYFFDFAFGEIAASRQSAFDFIIVVATFLFLDMFDTVGTLVACAEKTEIVNDDGSIPHCKQALLSDAIGTTTGAIFGTSTVTTFVESSAGVVAGGRTGLTTLVVGILFVISLFLAPLFNCVPSAGTAPALILVGVMMFTPVKDIELDDFTESIPSFLTILVMVVSSNISDGIMFGVLSYVFLKLITGKGKELRPAIYIIAILFVIKVIVGMINV